MRRSIMEGLLFGWFCSESRRILVGQSVRRSGIALRTADRRGSSGDSRRHRRGRDQWLGVWDCRNSSWSWVYCQRRGDLRNRYRRQDRLGLRWDWLIVRRRLVWRYLPVGFWQTCSDDLDTLLLKGFGVTRLQTFAMYGEELVVSD